MKQRKNFFLFSCILSTILLSGTISPSLTLKAHAETKAGTTTNYITEDGKPRTIFWADGITPPKMGGDDSDFKKVVTEINNVRYIEYIAPYQSGNGWYDINKTETQAQDANLCFAAVATNMLHWWIAQNTDNINDYLTSYPNAPRADEIRSLQTPVTTQDNRSIYNIFLKQFSNRKEGYWPDLLVDQFINGYYPKENAGTNDPGFDGPDLIQKGPDPNGGFFYTVFGTEILTTRHLYDHGYDTLSADLKYYITRGDLVSLTYDMRKSAHVVTIWGVEYDTDGHLTGVYFSDSDDDEANGMQRYSVINKDEKAFVTTADNGSGSLVSCITTLSTGDATWNKFLSPQQTELQLLWGETNFIYDGTQKKPELTASNIAPGDDVTLTVNEEANLVGTYTATAVLSGKDANRYILPTECKKEFSILPSQTIFDGGVKSYHEKNETTDFNYGDMITIAVTPKATGLSPNSVESPKVLLSPTNGQMALFADGYQLSNFVNADNSGTYTMTYPTSNGILSPGSCTLTAVFRGDMNMVNHSEDITIQLSGDTYISVDSLAPTCETDGIKAHYKDTAGKLYLKENGIMTEVSLKDLILPATGHQPGYWIQTQDKHYQECLNGCGYHLNEGNCTGGAAIFPNRATCEICGHPYGNYPEKPDIEKPDIETPNPDSPDPEVPNIEAPDIDAPNVEAPDIESPDPEDSLPQFPETQTPESETSDPESPDPSAQDLVSESSANDAASEKAVKTGDTTSINLLLLILLFSGILSIYVYNIRNNFHKY